MEVKLNLYLINKQKRAVRKGGERARQGPNPLGVTQAATEGFMYV
jgi:hypothetical protein